MPALSFKEQFVPLIESGAKRQTIRSRKHPLKVGDRLYLYTGMRTKNCTKIAESICIETQAFELCMYKLGIAPTVKIDGSPITFQQLNDLAVADGFRNKYELTNFFVDSPKAVREGVFTTFSGQIIKWGLLCKP